MTDAVTSPAGIMAGDVIVDAGCGIGGPAIFLAQRFGCRVIGVNISELQLEIAKRKLKQAGLAHLIDFRYGDCSQNIPLDDSSANAIVNIESACHYSNRPAFVRECVRILKVGGRLAACDWVASDRISSDLYKEFIQPVCDAWSLKSLETPDSYRGLLKTEGLEILSMTELSDGIKANMDFREKFYTSEVKDTVLKRWHISDGSIMLKFETLSRAWRAGCFTMICYLARTERPF
jgi:tocopherol O-methyltransferase